jgi:uncharacterized protein YjbI with pentapeptide repeats
MIDSDWYQIWEQVTITLTAIIGLLAFLRGLEHRKDSNFRDMAQSLSDPQSPVLRASAAAQLANYSYYRRFFFFNRPYREAALMLTLSALKRIGEQKHVRQQLANCLKKFLTNMPPKESEPIDLIDVQLQELNLHHFPFNNCDLTGAQLQDSDLGNASFVGSKLWKAQFRKSKCTSADFSKSKLWDANFEDANLGQANFSDIGKDDINEQTSFRNAEMIDSILSSYVREAALRTNALHIPLK